MSFDGNPFVHRVIKAKAEIHSYEEAEAFLDGELERLVARNVRISRYIDHIAVVLYMTPIIRYYPDGRWEADNGGWNTPTTSARASQFGPRTGPGEYAKQYFWHQKGVLLPTEGVVWVQPRMPGELEHDRLSVPRSHLRIIGTFEWNPNPVFPDNTRQMIRVASGTCYDARTPVRVIEVLEQYACIRTTRLRLHYGDITTGEDWCDEFDMEGRISRTMGDLTSPLLCHNARSDGGSPILDYCIVRIRFANRSDGGDLYRHPSYHVDIPKFQAGMPSDREAARVFVRHFA